MNNTVSGEEIEKLVQKAIQHAKRHKYDFNADFYRMGIEDFYQLQKQQIADVDKDEEIKRVAIDFARWVDEFGTNMNNEIDEELFETYLTQPPNKP